MKNTTKGIYNYSRTIFNATAFLVHVQNYGALTKQILVLADIFSHKQHSALYTIWFYTKTFVKKAPYLIWKQVEYYMVKNKELHTILNNWSKCASKF